MTNEAVKNPVLIVASPPHWHCGRTVRCTMLDFIIALLPAAVMAVICYGLPALRVMALACATAVVVEALCLKLMHRDVDVDNLNAVFIGLLFAFLLPAQAPWWLVVFGVTVSVALGKMAFGGLGANPLAAPLVGWAALRISWPDLMNINVSMLATPLENPLTQLKYLGLSEVSVSHMDMLLGSQLSGLGMAQVLPLLVGGVYLLIRGHIRPHIPLAFLGGVCVTALIYYAIDSSVYASPVFHLLAGGTVFGAFFLATDYSASPVNSMAMIVYGLLGGAMVIIIRVYGIYPDGVVFAVLLSQLFTSLLDMIRPKPFGAR